MDMLRLGIDVFARDLGDKVASTHFANAGSPTIEGFEIYDPNSYQLYKNRLYLCLDGNFPPCKHIQYGTGIICNTEHACSEEDCNRCDIIVVRDIEPFKLINEVSAIMARYNYLERAIMTSSDDLALDQFMEYAEMLVGYPVCILDVNLDVVAASANRKPLGNPLWESILNDEKPLRSEIVDHLSQSFEVDGRPVAKDGVREIELANWSMLTCNIAESGHPIASLWAFQTKPHRAFGGAEKSLLSWLSICIRRWAKRTKRLKVGRGHQRERFLLDLVDGIWRDDAAIVDAAKTVGLCEPQSAERIMIVARLADAVSHAGQYLSILNAFEEAVPGMICALSGANIIGIVGVDSNSYLPKDRVLALDRLCRSYGCVAFLGAPYKHLKDSPLVMRQLMDCFDLIGTTDEDRCLHEYCDYVLHQSMQLVVSMQPKETMLHPMVRRLIAYDLANNTDYLDTFKVYLNNRCNMTDTAKQLHMHRNTLLHRIKRIEELLESDLADWELRRKLLLSIDYLNLDDPERF